MPFKLFRRIAQPRRQVRRVRRSLQGSAADYAANKEAARVFIEQRLEELNQSYGFTYHRVAIRNSKTRWGSCSAKANLNFHYRLLHLPPELADYIMVHELCHLKELNHSPQFWKLVQRVVPDYRTCRTALRHWRSAA